MPTYVYAACHCPSWEFDGRQDIEKNVPISERDNQACPFCSAPLKRKIAFSGLTWAPTAGGMR